MQERACNQEPENMPKSLSQVTHLITFTPAHFSPLLTQNTAVVWQPAVWVYSLLHNTTMASSVFTRNLLPQLRPPWHLTYYSLKHFSSMPAYAQHTKKDHEDHHQYMILSCHQIIKLDGKEVAVLHCTAFQPRQWERQRQSIQGPKGDPTCLWP